MNRQTLLNLAILVIVGFITIAGFRTIVSFQSSFEFEPGPIEGLRTIAGGKVSAGFSPLVGISANSDARLGEVPENLCYALYRKKFWTSDLGVPVASFSDYNCPYCRIQTMELAELSANSSTQFVITWHELALLGEMSELAARAALAADRQGAYVAFQKKLMTSALLPTPAYLQEIASSIGIDGKRLLSDMQNPQILAMLQSTKDLSKHLRFIGTPGLVIGRTVILGYMPIDRIEELIEMEAGLGIPEYCQAQNPLR